MASFSIFWHPTNLDQLAQQEDYYWYAITDLQERLLYIGMSYNQPVQDRLSTSHHIRKQYAAVGPDLIVWLGEITYYSYRRITRLMIEDVEGLLIYLNQPLNNVSFSRSYTRRDNLIIRSRNCPLLLPIIQIKAGRFSPIVRLPASHGRGRFRPR